MLAKEMPESLQRQMICRGHSIAPNPAALKEGAGAGGSGSSELALLLPIVQVPAKGAKAEGTSDLTPDNPDLTTEEERKVARQRREALSRNETLANDFHAARW